MPEISTKPSALTLASKTASTSSSFFLSALTSMPELVGDRPELGDGQRCELLASDGRLWGRILMAAGTPATALAWTRCHAFFTFSQSARNDSSPRSVSGCFTRFLSTPNGTVAMSAPMSAACVTWFAERIEAAMTSTSCPKS